MLISPILVTLLALGSLLVALRSANRLESYLYLLMPPVAVYVAQVVRRLNRKGEEERAGIVFLSVHLFLLTYVFYNLGSPSGALPYAYGILIIVSGTILSPRAAFYTWLWSVVLMLGSLALREDLTWSAVFDVTAASVVNLFLAGLNYLSSFDWEIALRSVSDLHQKVQRRRDELWNTQQELRHANARLQALNTLLETSVAINQRVTSILELDQLLQEVASLIEGQFAYSRVTILLPTAAIEGLIPHHHGGALSLTLPDGAVLYATEADAVGQAVIRRQPVRVDDLALTRERNHVLLRPGARSELALPLFSGDDLMGVVDIQSERSGMFNADSVFVLRSLADQLTIAIQNARLYNQVSRFNQQLEQEVRRRTEDLQQAYDKLERLDRTKSDFIRVVSHELRTPLTVLQGYSGMLMQERMTAENEYLGQLVAGIDSGARRLHEVVNTMLDMVKIDSRALELYPEPVLVQMLISSLAGGFRRTLAERHLTLQIEGVQEMPAIEADPDALSKAFYHLIINAIKYTPDGGSIRITGACPPLSADAADSHLEIVVSDTGIGIDPEFHELIFTKFYQTGKVALHSSGKTKFKGGGPGLGLAIARGIVEAHQGKVWVESPCHDETTCPGSHFHVLLPLRQSHGHIMRGSTASGELNQ
ncbi:MAG: GAF domain-containing sensor histidine kinase [Anaerolineales bacterium]|nr:GAF domain-containing sensor histidine kinase [Anaerolineales bacterium]MCB8951835.1 GAF domain-containing sensor histidine kinase [Ardenticatenales bacterium]